MTRRSWAAWCPSGRSDTDATCPAPRERSRGARAVGASGAPFPGRGGSRGAGRGARGAGRGARGSRLLPVDEPGAARGEEVEEEPYAVVDLRPKPRAEHSTAQHSTAQHSTAQHPAGGGAGPDENRAGVVHWERRDAREHALAAHRAIELEAERVVREPVVQPLRVACQRAMARRRRASGPGAPGGNARVRTARVFRRGGGGERERGRERAGRRGAGQRET
jgi:hypothetical protein